MTHNPIGDFSGHRLSLKGPFSRTFCPPGRNFRIDTPPDIEHHPAMPEHVLVSDFIIPRPLQDTFAFFSDAANLERITPPWLNFRILTPNPIQMHTGTSIEYRISLKGIPIRWLSVISEWQPPHRFVDEQVRGPYSLWHHTHEFTAAPGGTRMVDTVRYRIPLGPLGSLAHVLFVRRDLARIFAYRRDNLALIMGPGPVVTGHSTGGAAGNPPFGSTDSARQG